MENLISSDKFKEPQVIPLENPFFQCLSIPSRTLKPFTHTNVILIADFETSDPSNVTPIIVDPGAQPESQELFHTWILKHMQKFNNPNQNVNVFLTHHHHDHVEALPTIAKIFPNATVLAHENTLKRVNTGNLKTKVLKHMENIQVSSKVNVKAVETKGHTDGHMCLFDEQSKIMIAGDHVVGFGTVTLDPENGDMGDYFRSTRFMISLNPNVVIPAHGNPNYKPIELLNMYLKHRQAREDTILEVYKTGKKTVQEIVPVVYKDVAPEMWPAAERNVVLHLRKLEQEGKLF